MEDKLYDIYELGNKSIYYNEYKNIMEYSLFNAKYLTWLQSLKEEDCDPTTNNPECFFCGEYINNRYYFSGQVFYINDWYNDASLYFLCKDAMLECTQFGEQYLLIHYILDLFADTDIKNIIVNLYLISLKHSKSTCITKRMENKCKELERCIKRCNKRCDKNKNYNLKDIKYFMSLNGINKPKGTGKNGCLIKQDYILAIKNTCEEKENVLTKLHTTLHTNQLKLINA